MDRARKEELVVELNGAFADAALVVVTHQSGLTVAESTDLRRRMREAGASFKVTKNRLVKLALVGTPYEGIADLFEGPTAIAYSADPVVAARVTVDFSKENEKLVVIGGAMAEDRLDEAGAPARQVKSSVGNRPKILASIPPKEDETPEAFAKRFLDKLSKM